ncbi:spartin a isoform X1 [Channa argus]|uniref:spartin a isoform X1 n=1 Tax=Channa argus TaxID=215402 RepID=UPI00351FC69A
MLRLRLSMAEPAELLLIKDQYELAFHALDRGLTAEVAGKRVEALKYYTKGRHHLTQGLEVPVWGQRRQGEAWDIARQLQQRMRDTLSTVNTHLSDLQTTGLTAGDQRDRLLMDLPPNIYPDLAPNSQPPHSSVHHLYPTIPPTTNTATPNTAPGKLASPAAPHRHTFASAASVTSAMASPGEQPPAYTPQPTDGHCSLAYGPAGGSVRSGQQTGASVGGDGDELLFIPAGVQLFFVAPNGEVSSLSNPGFLRVITCRQQNKTSSSGRPSAFLHVCDQLYPLIADTPVLLANSGIFMFPDSLGEMPGSYMGIVLSSELPATDQEMFQDLLSQLVDFRVQAPEGRGPEVINLSAKVPVGPSKEQKELAVETKQTEKQPLPGWSEKMGQGILSGATRLSKRLVQGAEVTGKAIHKGGDKIRERVTPEETPSEVSPRVTRGLQVAKEATEGAVKVSRFLVDGLTTVVGQVAEKMGPHLKKHGAKLIPESMKSQDGRPSKLDGAKFVAVSGVQGLSAIWSGLETGAKLVGKSVGTETVKTVKYKYGDHAGQATSTALNSVVNVGVAAYNIDNLAILAIVNAADKDTSKTTTKIPGGQPTETKEQEGKKK